MGLADASLWWPRMLGGETWAGGGGGGAVGAQPRPHVGCRGAGPFRSRAEETQAIGWSSSPSLSRAGGRRASQSSHPASPPCSQCYYTV